MSSKEVKKPRNEKGVFAAHNLKGLKKLNFDLSASKKRKTAKKLSSELGDASSSTQDGEEAEEIFEGEDLSEDDPFTLQFRNELGPSLLSAVSTKGSQLATAKKLWPSLGSYIVQQPSAPAKDSVKVDLLNTQVFASTREFPSKEAPIENLFIKSQIIENAMKANEKFNSKQLSKLQEELLTICSSYHDLYFPERTFSNGEEIRYIYCLHAINHVLKSSVPVSRHNTKLLKKAEVPEEFRDQGLVRPKVLILLPFRDSVLRVVKMMVAILLGDGGHVMNKKRFNQEFEGELQLPRKNPKPEDYQLLFSGNIDDSFRLGISLSRKSIKLYADFYSSDIILASPLGLRVLIGAQGERDRDYDFLSSIEVLIMDQSHVLSMQNWEHVLHVFEHMNLQPKADHGTDLSRVRMWTLNGWSKYYRQTLIFSSFPLPEITAVFYNNCHNYNGRATVSNPVVSGSIRQVISQIPQTFHFFNSSSLSDAVESRFNLFISNILPKYQEPSMKNTLIYVPSYFDYVRIRNHFKAQTVNFVQICEYSQDRKVARARDMFFHGQAHFLLYSERFHFFRRIRLKGIRHIIFYQAPKIPNFYSELCNFISEAGKKHSEDDSLGELSTLVLYSQFDIMQLSALVGSSRATTMIASGNERHTFITDD